ncbi:hypothetical protein LguiA_035564 [Lonicera macranthoides]
MRSSLLTHGQVLVQTKVLVLGTSWTGKTQLKGFISPKPPRFVSKEAFMEKLCESYDKTSRLH